jgi:hypothetical protein
MRASVSDEVPGGTVRKMVSGLPLCARTSDGAARIAGAAAIEATKRLLLALIMVCLLRVLRWWVDRLLRFGLTAGEGHDSLTAMPRQLKKTASLLNFG